LKWVEAEEIKSQKLKELLSLCDKATADYRFRELQNLKQRVVLEVFHDEELLSESRSLISLEKINRSCDKADYLFNELEKSKRHIVLEGVDTVKIFNEKLLSETKSLISLEKINETDPYFLNKLKDIGYFQIDFEKNEKQFSDFLIKKDSFKLENDESKYCITSQIQEEEQKISEISKNLSVNKEVIAKIMSEQKVKGLIQDIIDYSPSFDDGGFFCEMDETFGRYYLEQLINQFKQLDYIEKKTFKKESQFAFDNRFFVKYNNSCSKLHAHSHYSLGYSLLFNKNQDYCN